MFKKFINMAESRVKKYIERIKYNIGSKTHEEEFKRYALFGKWMVNNWRRIRIIDISSKGTY